jgi:hypothetical protein
MKKMLAALLILMGSGVGVFAQEVEVRLTMRDGNTMGGTTKLPNVSLVTDYGKLEIPIKNVSSIDLGIPTDKAMTDKVINLVKQLSNSSEDVRRNTYNELTGLSISAIPPLADFLYSPRYEPGTYTDYTPESALSDLRSKYNVSEDLSVKDVVNIDNLYTIGGSYDFKKIDLKTEYGTLTIPKEKIEHMDVMYASPGEGEMSFKLYASKHISANANGGWLKTGIMVKPGQKLDIIASGEITFASLSGSKYKPDGTVTGGDGGSYEGDYSDYNYGAASTYPTYGNVVYKIGDSGLPMKAGAKFSGAVTNSGMLYLSIYETVYNAGNTGSYSVKVSVK